MAKIQIEVKNCSECPFVNIKKVYTADSFEDVSAWYCTKENDKKIAGYVDWNDDPDIPEWCPIKI